jgi:hypothetical protein
MAAAVVTVCQLCSPSIDVSSSSSSNNLAVVGLLLGISFSVDSLFVL